MEPNLSNKNRLSLFYLEYDPIAQQATEIVSHLMKLVIGNSNNPYMTEICTLKPVLNQHMVLSLETGFWSGTRETNR